jgi:hypothetical protein
MIKMYINLNKNVLNFVKLNYILMTIHYKKNSNTLFIIGKYFTDKF